jgi:hypothetical protein
MGSHQGQHGTEPARWRRTFNHRNGNSCLVAACRPLPAYAHAPIPYQIQPTQDEEEWRNSPAIKMVEHLFGEQVRTSRRAARFVQTAQCLQIDG